MDTSDVPSSQSQNPNPAPAAPETNLPPRPPAAPPPPPPLPPPPPVLAPQPPRRQATSSSGRGWMIVSIILGFGLAIAIGSKILDFVPGMGMTVESKAPMSKMLEEIVVENNHSGNKVAVIDVDGVITGSAIDASGGSIVSLIKEQLKRAEKDDDVKAVILKVDSPGGEVLASDDIYRLIVDFQNDTSKPVIASMGSLAASGGYYVSAPCRWIVANELTMTGSIGVIMHGYNYRGLMNKVGVRPEVFKSGKFKDMLSGDKEQSEILPEEREMVQEMINETFARFKKIVADGRKYASSKNSGQGKTLASNWEDYADGRILTGRQAHEHGFVDEVGNFDIAVARTLKIAGINNANLVKYHPPFTLGNLFGGIFGKSEAKTVKVDLGMNLPKIRAGRLYFLSPIHLE